MGKEDVKNTDLVGPYYVLVNIYFLRNKLYGA